MRPSFASLCSALALGACTPSSPPSAPEPGRAPVDSGVVAPSTALPPASAGAPASRFAYPPAPRGPVVDELHGLKSADPYRWLESLEAKDTRAWVTAENQVTDAYFAKLPGKDALRARLGELLRFERYSFPRRKGGRFFFMHNDGKQDQGVLFTTPSLDAVPAVLLDPNTLSPDGSLALVGFGASHDGARVTYGLSSGGGDWQKWRVRDVGTGKDLPDELTNIKYYPPAFTRDGKGLYYSRFPAPPPGKELIETDHDCKVYYHALGTDPAKDVVVYERPEKPTWQFDPAITSDGRYLVITIGDGQVGDRGVEQVVYLDLAAPKGKPVPLVDRYDAEYLFLGNEGPVFYFKTTLGAPKKRVIAIDTRAPSGSAPREIVPEGPDAIDDASLAGRQLFVTALKNAHGTVAAYDLKGKKLRDIALPGFGTVYGFWGEPEDKDAYYLFTSFTTPAVIYCYEIGSGKSQLWKAPKVAFDPSAFETKQVFFPSKDGTKVPMFITAKKGLPLDGNNPTRLTAYGFGGLSMTPHFDPTMVAWLERKGVEFVSFFAASLRVPLDGGAR
jgi:prolyl oligopeptidase